MSQIKNLHQVHTKTFYLHWCSVTRKLNCETIAVVKKENFQIILIMRSDMHIISIGKMFFDIAHHLTFSIVKLPGLFISFLLLILR